MKTTVCISPYIMIGLLVLLGVFPIYSCSTDPDTLTTSPEVSENPDSEPPVEDKVRTLVMDLGANDALSVTVDGTIFASNFENFEGTQIVRVNPESLAVEVAVANLQAPTGNITDAMGNIYVVHNARRVASESNELIGDVLKIASDGNRTTLATLPGFPSGIALDDQGNLYISNFAFPGIHRITPDGETTIYAQDPRLIGGVGIDFDDIGNLFVSNFNTGAILKINTDKSIQVLATIPTVQERAVIGYITYLNGFIYATALGEHVVYSVSMSGEATIFAGSGNPETVDGSLLNASFNTPNGITSDPNNNVLYVTGRGNALRVIDLD